ncbi:hypothetical protein ACFOMD_05625 [Sphingoaurantiacus capsulatus]|uniref:Uncharacterized protein n=1 Tax=Sphingoaurantiacus capsulatus TaxID=1771310 RepID=A0ABV7X7B5_9SPHN
MRFVPPGHPFHGLSESFRTKIASAQNAALDPVMSSAGSLAEAVFEATKLAIAPQPAWYEQPSSELADRSFAELVQILLDLLVSQGSPRHAAQHSSVAVAQRLHLQRAFAEPDRVVSQIRNKVLGVVGDFPTQASDIECGRNPGDVLDPYILAATQYLVCAGDFQKAVSATVSHKALMIIEGLMGHLHEDVLGEMRGNVRVPEPTGANKAVLNVLTNPFPGADLLQVPLADGDAPKFHQIKSKTGSAKGGDGERLGLQLAALRSYYGGEIYYDALIGNTLRGHRSRAAVERVAPGVVVLVGESAFRSLTRSAVGPELLLRVYQTAFREVADTTGYDIEVMTAQIFQTFADKATAAGEGYLEAILHDATGGSQEQQDNRHFASGRTRRV